MNTYPRFKAHTFVGRNGRAQLSTMEGWALFDDIFANTPADCRFMIVETCTGEFECWDFQCGGFQLAHKKVPKGVVRWTGPSADALVMKAIALYDQA